MSDIEQNIEALLSEERVFPPPAEFVERAIVNDPEIYDRANADYEAFWAEQAERLTWFSHWDSVMEWDAALGEVVLGGHAQRFLQLPGPSRGGRGWRQGRLPLGRRTR